MKGKEIIARVRLTRDNDYMVGKVESWLKSKGFEILKASKFGISFQGSFDLYEKKFGPIEFHGNRLIFKNERSSNLPFNSLRMYFPSAPTYI